MNGIIDALAFIGHIVFEDDQILHVLVGLSHMYDAFIVFITSRSEPLKFEDIIALLMENETKLEQHHHNLIENSSLDINIATLNSNITPHFSQGKKIIS